jgi:hypothetical protein
MDEYRPKVPKTLMTAVFPIANRDARPLEITVSQRTTPRIIVDIRMTAD